MSQLEIRPLPSARAETLREGARGSRGFDREDFRDHMKATRGEPSQGEPDTEIDDEFSEPTQVDGAPAGAELDLGQVMTMLVQAGQAAAQQVAQAKPAAIACGTLPSVEIPAELTTPSIQLPAVLTPLEQQVRELIAQIEPEIEIHDQELDFDDSFELPLEVPGTDVAFVPAATSAEPAKPAATAATHIAAPAAPLPADEAAQALHDPSHVHLVLDDGPERVVVTVAVRGSDVNVALRGGDEATAAALARNAGVLDDALRTRGLDLSSFTAQRDHQDRGGDTGHDQPDRRRDDAYETFTLEDLVA